jgi:hypothetical protein
MSPCGGGVLDKPRGFSSKHTVTQVKNDDPPLGYELNKAIGVPNGAKRENREITRCFIGCGRRLSVYGDIDRRFLRHVRAPSCFTKKPRARSCARHRCITAPGGEFWRD